MVLTLISATPSPFARMNRITMLEKGIPFELQNEVPWDSTTKTPDYNPLEKLPILIFDDGRAPVYDSSYIQEYLVAKYPQSPKLLTGNMDTDLKIRQVMALSQGLLDAFVLGFFETRRETPSKNWMARQDRKIDGAMKALDELCESIEPKGSMYLFGDAFTLADIAAACAVAQVNFGQVRPQWKETYPTLAKWWEKMEEKESFKSTEPIMFELKDQQVG